MKNSETHKKITEIDLDLKMFENLVTINGKLVPDTLKYLISLFSDEELK